MGPRLAALLPVALTLDGVADELYAVPPDEFVERREARRGEARADGDRALAQAIGKFRKPTTAAWVVNVLARREPAELTQLVDLGAALREAQDSLDGDELRELAQQRHRVVAALARQARSLAAELGRPVSESVAGQVQDTLRAAIADEDAGEAVLSGRLLTALSHRGLSRSTVRGAVADVGRENPSGAGRGRPAGRARPAAGDRRREDRRRALERARAELAEADTAAGEADEEARAARDRLAEVSRRRDETRTRIADLEDQLRRAEREAGELTEDVRAAQRERDAGERRAGRAEAFRDRLRARVARLAEEAEPD